LTARKDQREPGNFSNKSKKLNYLIAVNKSDLEGLKIDLATMKKSSAYFRENGWQTDCEGDNPLLLPRKRRQ